MQDIFKPKPIVRNSLFQTVFGSLKMKSQSSTMTDCAEEIILNGLNNEKLLAYYSRQSGNTKGTVLLIHGWEGSSNSTYITGTGKHLFEHGFDIIRLNLRDHGDSHHLNRGIFKSTLINETFGAVKNAAMLNKSKPFFVVGFSLGGNFALRIALKAGKTKIHNLKHVTAISPVLDPSKSMIETDKSSIIKKYFIKKWARSLEKKQSLFPDLYNFSEMYNYANLVDLMSAFVPKYTEFKSTKEYYKRYSLLNNVFNDLKISALIITSKDDPIIPVEDFYNLNYNKNLKITILPYGGHNGFFDLFPYKVWYHDKLLNIFNTYS